MATSLLLIIAVRTADVPQVQARWGCQLLPISCHKVKHPSNYSQPASAIRYECSVVQLIACLLSTSYLSVVYTHNYVFTGDTGLFGTLHVLQRSLIGASPMSIRAGIVVHKHVVKKACGGVADCGAGASRHKPLQQPECVDCMPDCTGCYCLLWLLRCGKMPISHVSLLCAGGPRRSVEKGAPVGARAGNPPAASFSVRLSAGATTADVLGTIKPSCSTGRCLLYVSLRLLCRVFMGSSGSQSLHACSRNTWFGNIGRGQKQPVWGQC